MALKLFQKIYIPIIAGKASMRTRIGNLAKKILDICLPPRKGEILVRDMTTEEISQRISEDATSGEAGSFSYKNDLVRSLIWELKYHKSAKALEVFSSTFYDLLLAEASEERLFGEDRKILLVPIPASKGRMKERGFNGVSLLADEILKKDTDGVFEDGKDILSKDIETPRQTAIKDRGKRMENVRGSFSCPDCARVRGRTVFVIDDVTTTGATLAEAEKVLMEAGAKTVRTFALAH